MATAKQRAIDAQVMLYDSIRGPFRKREGVAEALRSVASTARIATLDSGGMAVSHGHKSVHETNPARWAKLEENVWKVIQDGYTPGGIWEVVGKQMKEVGVTVGTISDIITAQTKRSKAA